MNDVSFFAPASLSNQGISVTENSIELQFIGEPIKFILQQGRYRFEAYGASGGAGTNQLTSAKKTDGSGCIDQNLVIQYQGNADCQLVPSTSGAGGYAAGTIEFKHPVKMYVRVGGAGTFGSPNAVGGYNGGGSSRDSLETGCVSGSGGGATDFRLFEDSLYNRILVAGGGGGADNSEGTFLGQDDGSGGAGGLPSQGIWIDGVYSSEFECNSTKGFTFGQGQQGIQNSYEAPGAGGGFFGGKAHTYSNAGASGGSSFALADDIPIPEGYITAQDETGNVLFKKQYAFSHSSPFKFTNLTFLTGIRIGNGLARITLLEKFDLIWPPFVTCFHSFSGIIRTLYLSSLTFSHIT